VWGDELPIHHFTAPPEDTPCDVRRVMEQACRLVQETGTPVGGDGKISESLLDQLRGIGFWGLPVDRAYGGLGASIRSLAPFLTQMATIDSSVAALASVHGCIGAVNALQSFGSPEQQRRLLPRLASGDSLSALALTEPGAGTDVTALRTQARLEGDAYIVNGEKLFVTNLAPGRVIVLICHVQGRPEALMCELPDRETASFRLRDYGLHALRRLYNRGVVFRNFRVPAENALVPARGDGMTVAYHALNRGRVALCATVSGRMRRMLANLIPWVTARETYGRPIGDRQLVRRRLGQLAGFIVACDALVNWCAGLLAGGYRGQLESMVAKRYASEAIRVAAVDLFMKTCGGRSLLQGHLFGDNVHDWLATLIYEGESEMLGLALLGALVGGAGEPLGQSASEQRVAWPAGLPEPLAVHARFAAGRLADIHIEIEAFRGAGGDDQPADQCRMVEVADRIQAMVVILCTCLYAAQQDDPRIRQAADVICRDLTHRLEGARPTDDYFRVVTDLGRAVVECGFPGTEHIRPDALMMV
jgi:alkylation response protein AidB-like acyl-CoA dehydrogenase